MTLRMRVLPRFPAKITGTNGLTVERPTGTPDLIVKPDFGSLVQIPNVGDGDNVFFMAWDRLLGLYRIMSFNDLFDGVADLGFMEESVYDPQGKHADAFARANHTGVQAISTITGLQTALDGKIPLADGVRYDAAQTNTAARQAQARTNISAALKNHRAGLTLSNNATDATNDIDIAVGEAASTESDPVLMVLGSALTKRLDAAWAVGTGSGGLDTGSIANNTYHVFLIQRSDTLVVDVLFSLSASSPTMPANYDRKRRIGSILRQAGAINGFTHAKNVFMLSTPIVARNDTSALASSLLSFGVPAGIQVEPIVFTRLDTNAASVATISLGSAASGAAGTAVHLAGGTSASNSLETVYGGFLTNTSNQLYAAQTLNVGTLSAAQIGSNGWVDTFL